MNGLASFAKEPYKNKALLQKSPTKIRLFCKRGLQKLGIFAKEACENRALLQKRYDTLSTLVYTCCHPIVPPRNQNPRNHEQKHTLIH